MIMSTFTIDLISGEEMLLTNIDSGGGDTSEREITSPTLWDGSSYSIDLSSEKQFTRTINNGVTTLTLALTFPSDSATKSREIIVRLDNSNNASAISNLTWTGNWEWAIGDPVIGIAAGAIIELVVRNISVDIVKAYTDTEV